MDRKKNISLLIIAVAVLTAKQLSAQVNTTQGFVQQENIKIQHITSDALIYPLSDMQKQTIRSYYDGLGRTVQTIAVQASPNGNDIIQPVAYDNLGRQTVGYLPYADETGGVIGSYRSNAISTGQPGFYNNTGQYLIPVDTAAHYRSVFEKSPMQRLLNQGMVGTNYQPGDAGTQHFKTASYRPSNSSDGNILQWNPDGSYTANTYYNSTNPLWVTDGKDEDNVETLLFTDMENHTILKRQIHSGGNLDTYYIYNNAGMLIYIVPPNATALLVPTTSFALYSVTAPLSNMIFNFIYDTMGRLTQKTVPSKGVVYIVYDPLNRPVLIQDANMRVNNNWNYIKYDAEGRAISEGIYTDASHTSLSTMQYYVSNTVSYTVWYEYRTHTASTTGYYTNNVFPTNGTPLAYSYYDDYLLTENPTGAPDFSYVTQSDPNLPNEETATTAQLKGMPTMIVQTTVGSGLTNTWLTTVTFYDQNLHVIQQRSNNQVYYTGYQTSAALTDTKTAANDFTGMPLYSKTTKQSAATGGTTTVYTSLTYDQAYRVTNVSQIYNTGAYKSVAAYSYNEIGQLIKKSLGYVNSTTWLQTVNFRFNIRGQLLYINNSALTPDGGATMATTDSNDLFGMQFLYDAQDTNFGNTPSYDGKLTEMKWMTKDGVAYQRGYKYSYDDLNRYTGATYAESAPSNLNAFNKNNDGFDENNITYDAGGNIKTLNRNMSTEGTTSYTQIDQLTYTYNPNNLNQLYKMADASAGASSGGFINYAGAGTSSYYQYDANGNLMNDPYKGLTFGNYDFLNKIDKVTLSAGNYVDYTYNASGQLIHKRQYSSGLLTNATDYLGDGFVYVNGTLSYFQMPEGRVLNNGGGTFKQEFIITDQQGNARISFQDNGSGVATMKQENSYYGFGLLLPNSVVGISTPPNKKMYNGGSEWQNDFFNLPDYYQTVNRNYDASLGRFVGVDPTAEASESESGYQYADNNPIMLNDPSGNEATIDYGLRNTSVYNPYNYSEWGFGQQAADFENNLINGMNVAVALEQAENEANDAGAAGGATGAAFSLGNTAALYFNTLAALDAASRANADPNSFTASTSSISFYYEYGYGSKNTDPVTPGMTNLDQVNKVGVTVTIQVSNVGNYGNGDDDVHNGHDDYWRKGASPETVGAFYPTFYGTAGGIVASISYRLVRNGNKTTPVVDAMGIASYGPIMTTTHKPTVLSQTSEVQGADIVFTFGVIVVVGVNGEGVGYYVKVVGVFHTDTGNYEITKQSYSLLGH